MDPRLKRTHFQFTQTELSTQFCAELDKMVQLHDSEPAMRWFYGRRTIGSILQAVQAKVSFDLNDKVNDIFLKLRLGLQVVAVEAQKELTLERMRQTIKAITVIKMSPALSPCNLSAHKSLILSRLHQTCHEIDLLQAKFSEFLYTNT